MDKSKEAMFERIAWIYGGVMALIAIGYGVYGLWETLIK